MIKRTFFIILPLGLIVIAIYVGILGSSQTVLKDIKPSVLDPVSSPRFLDPDQYIGEELAFEEVDIGCLPGLLGNSVSFVVRNQNEYDNLRVEYYEKTKEEYKKLWGVTTDEELNKGMPFKNCDAKLTPINFEEKTLLSHYADGSGCITEFNNDVRKDNLNKKIIFTIEVIEHGTCEPFNAYRSSILIPKIPDDYSVDFRVKK
jgi:hypothetical protein